MANTLFKRVSAMLFASIAFAAGVQLAAAQPQTGTVASPATSTLQACYRTCEKKQKDATAYEGCMIECKKAHKLANPAGDATKR